MNPQVQSPTQVLRNLDVTIANLGDGHILNDNGKLPSSGEKKEVGQENKVNLEESILKRFSPVGLEEPFKQLYSIIFPALHRDSIKNRSPLKNSNTAPVPEGKTSSVVNPPSTFKTVLSSSSAAILMGVKGSGKTLLLERVLAACREQLQNCGRRLYRMVEINGIVCRGEDVASVVYEIIRQLSGIAYRSIQITKKSKSPMTSTAPSDTTSTNRDENSKEKTKSLNPITDTKSSTWNENNEMDEIGRQDDDKDYINNDIVTIDIDKEEDNVEINRKRKRRQRKRKQRKIEKHMLRLRQATFNSNLALLESILKLAATDDIPILLNIDELDSFTDEGERQMLLYHFLDRVATPGSNLILVGMTSSFSALTLLEKRIRSRAEGTAKIIYLRTPPTYEALLKLLEHKLEDCILCRDILDRIPHPKNAEAAASALLSKSNVDTQGTAVKKYNENVQAIVKLSNAMEREFRLGKDIRWFSRAISISLTLYRNDYVMQMSRNTAGTLNCVIPLSFCAKYIWDAMSMMGASVFDNAGISRQPDLCLIEDVAVSPRLQALLDLSTPQVALLLSARRILKREEHRDQAVLAPLTIERILKEYESFRRGSTSKGNSKLLKRAVHHLMQQGLVVPSVDHSGGGPLHYDITKIYKDMDQYALSRLPLHVPLDIDRELKTALEQNLLECPTALKEWGKSISKST